MKKITIHDLKVATGFALLGAVVAGILFGGNEYTEHARVVSAFLAIGIAKYFKAF